MPAVDRCQLAEFLLFSGGSIVAASRRFGDQGKDPTHLYNRIYIRFCAGNFDQESARASTSPVDSVGQDSPGSP